MRKKYLCHDCGAECGAPAYLRLQITRLGWKRASQQPRWQKSIPVGHFCEECLWARVRTAMGNDFDLARVDRHPGPADTSVGCAHDETSLTSFSGRLAQIRATQACDRERRA